MNGLIQALSGFWDDRNPRERVMLLAALAIVVIGLFYLLLIDPALNGRQAMEKQLPALRQQAAQVRALAKEATELSAKTMAPAPPLTRENLEASLASKGLKAQNVSVTGNIARVQLSTASFASMLDWLDELQRTAKVAVTEANIEPLAQADTVNATLTLRQQRSDQTQ